MNRPDYIVIGAMKCGTSTLAVQLGAQPGLFMTEPKEPNFFSDDSIYERGFGWYSALFDGAEPGDVKGEASTHYTKRPDLPEAIPRMKAALPEVRLVYMIRDPMVRLVSHYIHAWSEGETTASIAEALETMPSLFDYGRYGWQIAPYFETYGADAILLTSLERLKAEPEAELTRIARHVGHEGTVAWVEEAGAQNVSSERVRKLPLHGLLVDNSVATALRRTLVPKALRSRIRAARQMTQRPAIPTDVLPTLRRRYADDRQILASLFPGDPSLDLAYPWMDA